MNHNAPLAVSIAEAAEVSGVGRTALYAAAARGEIRFRKRGRRTLVLTSELREWLDSLPAANLRAQATGRAHTLAGSHP
ncbi:MAG: helix-turn-helix domain-containing protein [Sphingobium sp.]